MKQSSVNGSARSALTAVVAVVALVLLCAPSAHAGGSIEAGVVATTNEHNPSPDHRLTKSEIRAQTNALVVNESGGRSRLVVSPGPPITIAYPGYNCVRDAPEYPG